MSLQHSRRARRLSIAGLAVGAMCAVAPALPAHAGATASGVRDWSTPVVSPAAASRRAPVLDGFRLTHLPTGLGTPSDFEYEWNDVTFHSRDWESRHGAGWRVDLTIETLRGDRLSSLAALRGYLTDYLEQDPGSWRLRPVPVGSHPGLRTDDRVFWLVRPGLAVSVDMDPERYGPSELLRTARGVHEQR
ncbi:hypothetical protein Athai_31760 [Actinocatenispora thailandica]|uniref:Secreted protein n=1 Tax=Actinocatenispora thailandica TaxID=227318 RepID=A0A7R7HX84_9ACTN|nr:hypothetical protein [Actinocatenispora thailandica]BCJ35673.1 hypothetical protein Athai_31760 [Actinocatenispora thailandica]